LKKFDEYSQGKYSDIVNKKILRKEFEILKIEKKLKQLKGPKYKSIYNDIGLKEKTIIYAMCYFPKMCRRIASFEKCMKQYMEIVRQSLSNYFLKRYLCVRKGQQNEIRNNAALFFTLHRILAAAERCR